MGFVNEIADISHNQVDSTTGAPNKNIGEAFLFVWKFPQDQLDVDPNGNPMLRESKKVR